jgi:type IV pilus assembly protein PilM
MSNAGIGVTVGSHSLRAVGVKKKGDAWTVTKVVGQRAEEGMRADAGRILAAKGVRGVPVSLGLSGKDVIIRYNAVPPVPEWRLRNLMKFEVMEVSGQSGGEVSADYRKLNLPDPDGTRGEDTVLVCLARNAYLEPLMKSLEAGGLKFRGGCPNSVGLFNAFAVNATYREDETCLLVNVGAQGMDLALERGGELIFARNASPGGRAFTEAIAAAFGTTEAKAETLKTTKADVTPRGQARYADATGEKVANAIMGVAGQIAQLIQSTLMIGRAQTKIPDLKVDRVMLAGGGASLKGLDAYLKQAMGVPVERFDPFSACDLSELPEAEKALVEAAPHEYAVALGLAQTPLAPAAFRLSVVPEAVRKRRDFATKGVFSVAAAAAALAALGVLYAARKDASAATVAQRATLVGEEKTADGSDQEFRKVLANQEEVQAKHRILAELAAPGPLLSEALALLESGQGPHPEVYLAQVVLVVEDPVGGYTLIHPKDKLGTGYVERPHSRAVRGAVVRAIGRISPGTPSPEKVFNEYVQRVKTKDKRFVVTTRKVFNVREGTFELEIAPGITLRPTGVEKGAAWVLRTPTFGFSDAGVAETVTGIGVDGVPVTLRKEQVDAEGWKDLIEAFPPSPPPAAERKE